MSTRVKLLGFIPAWNHRQHFARVDDENREMLVEEPGTPYEVWNHLMRADVLADRRCRFVDQIEVEAGPLTPIVWISPSLLCRIRMRRLSELARVLA